MTKNLINGRYQKDELISSGFQTATYKVKDIKDKNKIMILKEFNLTKESEKFNNKSIDEFAQYAQFSHENILKYYDKYLNDSVFHLLIEFYDDDFKHVINQGIIKKNKTISYMNQLLNAIEYLHSVCKYIHKDIKPDNILIIREKDKEIIKLANIGIFTPLDHLYMSPEILTEEPFTRSTDIWSLGVILYEMCTQKLPFHKQEITNPQKIFEKFSGQYEIFNNLLEKMLEREKEKRISTFHAKEILNSIEETSPQYSIIDAISNVENAHSDSTLCIQLVSNNAFVSGSNNSLKFWSIDNFQCIHHIKNSFSDWVECLQLLSNNILVNGSYKSLSFWDINTFKCIHQINNAHQGTISCIQLLPNNMFVSGSDDKSLKFWNSNSFKCIYHIENAHQDWIDCLQLLPDNILVSGSADKCLRFWNIKSFQSVYNIECAHDSRIRCLQLFKINMLVSGSDDKSLKIWNSNTFQCVYHFENAHQDSILCLQLLPNSIIVSGSKDKSLKFWNLNSFQCIFNIENAHRDWIECLELLPNNMLVSGSDDKSLKFWNINSLL